MTRIEKSVFILPSVVLFLRSAAVRQRAVSRRLLRISALRISRLRAQRFRLLQGYGGQDGGRAGSAGLCLLRLFVAHWIVFDPANSSVMRRFFSSPRPSGYVCFTGNEDKSCSVRYPGMPRLRPGAVLQYHPALGRWSAPGALGKAAKDIPTLTPGWRTRKSHRGRHGYLPRRRLRWLCQPRGRGLRAMAQ